VEGLDIIVIGAGIGGLTAAVALQHTGHRVRVIDQARELRPMGAGISLWSNGVKVLDALGLGADVAAVGGRMQRMGYRDQHGNALCEFSLAPLIDRVGEHPYPVRRSDLQSLLLRAAGPANVSTGQRCDAVDDTGDRVVVHLEGGGRLDADLAVAADGTHSRLRAHVVGHETPRTYLGYHNWNGLVPDDAALADAKTWMMCVGEGKRVSTMPVRDGQYFFFDVPLAEPIPSGRPPQAALRDHFAGWNSQVQRLIDAIEPDGVANLAIHTHEPIEHFARGRVALLGDAAHTAAPDLGQGGCMAMEDAVVLSNYLRTTNLSVEDALTRYSGERVPRAADIIRRAADRAGVTHGADPDRTASWYDELAHEDGTSILDGIAKSILTGPCR
jgi:FAD-dependent urate hydroxylase